MEIYRHRHGDSDRTKLLKEVLISNAQLAKDHDEVQPNRYVSFPASGSKPIATTEKVRSGNRGKHSTFDASELKSLVQQSDKQCAGLIECSELSPILRQTGLRISNLCSKLQSIEGQPKDGAIPSKTAAQDTMLRITKRPEESAVANRCRVDESVMRAIGKHARYEQLDQLSGVLDNCGTSEQLRKARLPNGGRAFPRREPPLHPNTVLLTDYLFENKPEEFRDVMRKRYCPQAASSRAGPELKLNLSVDWQRNRRVKMNGLGRDRSAPAILNN